MPETAFGSYLILGKLGEGGMGEVYRARDTRLNRDVALKLLPPQLADDPERIARLRREAQSLAALNHSNIAQVYALEESAGRLALVMELVEGLTIAELLGTHRAARAGLPTEQAIAIARQIADAMEAAHEAGIIHRDLKPSNVKVRDDGTVKVLDFGLAKAADDRLRSADLAMSPTLPTLTSPAMTSMGMILGTAAYLAPEQAKGRPADKRADIWAFGCVLWEMLTGTALFARETMSETLAAVLKELPPWERLPADLPQRVRALLARCLERDARQRLRDIGEARIALSAPLDRFPDTPARGHSVRFWLAVAGAAVALALGAAAAVRLSTRTPLTVRRLDLPPEIASRTFALSQDGRQLAYVSTGHLFVRHFDALDAVDLGAVPPDISNLVWSPDAQAIAFSGEGRIQSIPASGGPMFTVCRIPAAGRTMGMAWIGSTSSIAFSVWRDSLYTVPASGGAPALYMAVDRQTEVDFHNVMSLPDGRLIVDSHKRASDSTVAEIVDGTRRMTLASGSKVAAVGVFGDRALFLRYDVNPGLWAAPFGNNAIAFREERLVQPNAVDYDASSNGDVVVQVPAVSMHQLVSVDGKGTVTPLPGSAVANDTQPFLAVSPDGRRVAFLAGSPVRNLFVRDLPTGRDTQLTFARAGDETDSMWTQYLRPSWLPSSDRLLHGTGRIADIQLIIRRSDAAGVSRPVTAGNYGVVSRDGRVLVYIKDESGRGHVMRANFRPDGSVDTPQPFFRGGPEPYVSDLDLSPDGRLLAYAAVDDDNRLNVYLTDVPDAQGRVLVDAGAARPRFAASGKELFYVKGSTDAGMHPFGTLMSVAIAGQSTASLGKPAGVLDDKDNGLEISGFAVTGDGQFVIPRRVPPAPGKGERVVLIENWPALVHR